MLAPAAAASPTREGQRGKGRSVRGVDGRRGARVVRVVAAAAGVEEGAEGAVVGRVGRGGGASVEGAPAILLRVRVHVAVVAGVGWEGGGGGIVCRGDRGEGVRRAGIHAVVVVGEVGRVVWHSKRWQGRSLVVCAPGAALAEGVEGAWGREAAGTADRRARELVRLRAHAWWAREGHASEPSRGARGRDRWCFLGVPLARLGETRGHSALKIGDDLWGRMAVERGVGCNLLAF